MKAKDNSINVVIRKATKDDADGKGYVHFKAWLDTYAGIFTPKYMDKLSLERKIKIAYEHPENTFVALVEDKIVGFSCYMESEYEYNQKSAGEITAMYILKEHQGFGIGKQLISACYDSLNDYSLIFLWVVEQNDKAINFYTSQGFISDGAVKTVFE